MPLQSMALGIPTIITPTSGQAQYANLASVVIPITPKRCDVHEITNFAGFWDEPDFDTLVEALRGVCGDSDRYKAEALSRVGQVGEYSWVKSCRKLLNVLPEGGIIDDPVQEPFVCHLKIQVNRKCEAGINNDHWNFVPGVDYIVDHVLYDILTGANYVQSFEIVERSNNMANKKMAYKMGENMESPTQVKQEAAMGKKAMAKKAMHKMPNGKMMPGKKHKKK